ncbi:MAG TPA: mechanosensitive ion channel family protein [Spirochaetota bacterium]|nr:mechanosensitive ion channel family protein [Spirochaetota bacterium]
MADLFSFNLDKFLNPDTLLTVLRVVIIVVAGFVLLKILNFSIGRTIKKRFSQQTAMLIKKGIFYAGAFIILVTVLRQLGFKLTALLGAAGIAGIAIGFASQTSVSNIISGLFLISEKPFAVGDIIKAGGTTGIILSIDLLSVKIRTFDNLFIRIPNEQLIKQEVTNVTRFPIRRLNIDVSIAYKDDIGKAQEVLLDVAKNNPYCLDNPEPYFVIKEFGAHGIDLMLGAWFSKPDYTALNNTIMQEIKERFDGEGIEIPFPHVSVYTGSVTEPFPVQVIREEPNVDKPHS